MSTGYFKGDRLVLECFLQDFPDCLLPEIERDRLFQLYLFAIDKRKTSGFFQLADKGFQRRLPDMEVQTRRLVLCGKRRDPEDYP